MKKTRILVSPQSFSYLLPLLLLFIFAGCQKEALPDDASLDVKASAETKTNTFYGPARQLGDGVVRSMVTMTRDGVPVEIGIRLSEKALQDLPDEVTVVELELPNKMEGLAFDHIDFDWNPHGHEPEFLYGAPHFDLHFYMISREEQMQVIDPAKAAILPAAEYIPEGYFLPAGPELVPYMGVHWLSMDAPELPPSSQEFTSTFIYGSYDGSFIFMEPMFTLDYLMNAADGTEMPIPQPEEFEQAGYYPTSYKMYYDAQHKDYIISMGDMKWYD